MVTVGIDPHKRSHTAVLIDDADRRLGRPVRVADDPDAVGTLLRWAAGLAPGENVTWAVEDGRGLARRLATGLAAAGQPAVWVPVRLMAGARRRGACRGKSDPIDAEATARAAANPDNAAYLAPVSLDEPGRDLGYLLDERRDTLAERTRRVNKTRWWLHQLGPDLEPKTLTTLSAPGQLKTRLQALPASVPRDLLLDACDELSRLTRRIKNLDKRIAARVHTQCPTLLARPGVGPIVAATLLAELGEPRRIRSSAAFARMAGVAPIPVWSGNNERHRLDHGGNRRLNHALHTVALTQARSHPAAQTLIARHRDNNGYRGAIRVLKRHLADALYRDLLTDFPPTSNKTAA